MTDRLRDQPGTRTLDERLAFGVVNLDKPPGPSAHQVAGWVRDLADVDRAAHAGTLDPKVTGCLPVMLGNATRLAPVFLEGRKEYVAVLELHGRLPADLDDVLAEFEGEIYQKPPRKSAVARRLRSRTIHDLTALETRDRQVLLRIECESGTYIRKLCHDLGLALGTGAHMGALRRTATDPFDDHDLVALHDLADALAFAEDDDEGPLREVVAPAERVLDDLPTVTIAPSAAEQVATGAPVYAPGVIDSEGAEIPRADGEAVDSVEHGPTGSRSEADGSEALPMRKAGEPDDDPLVACFTPNGSAVCLGRLVGDPTADSGVVVDLERVLV